jgi:hypothetical protein
VTTIYSPATIFLFENSVWSLTFTVPMWFVRMWSLLADVVGRRSGNPLWYTSESLHALRFNPAVSGAKAEAALGQRLRTIDETGAGIHRWAVTKAHSRSPANP